MLVENLLYFFGNLLYFFVAIGIAFFIPGTVVLSRFSLQPFVKIVLSIVVGMVLWAWQGFIFGFLGVRWVTYGYLFVFVIVWYGIYLRKKEIRKKIFSIKQSVSKTIDPWVALLIIVGVIFHLSIVLLMGIRTHEGLYLCCGATTDFLYHLDLTSEIIRKIPPNEPFMYGVLVTNYHYLGNIVVAELVRIFHLPLVFTQFQYMGFVLSVLFGCLAVAFGIINNFSKTIIRWFVFFLYFGGDYIYIVILVVRRKIDFTMGPLENGLAFLNNPPRAFAVVAFLAGVILFSLWIKKKNSTLFILTGLVFASLAGFKVYLGIFALSGLLGTGVYQYLFKKDKAYLFLFLFSAVMTLIMYIPVNRDSGGMFFTGFWRFEEFIAQPALGLSDMILARQIFSEHGNWLRVIQYEIIFGLLFFFSIFGIKLLGLIQSKAMLKLLPIQMHMFFLAGCAVSIIAGTFFWQKSGGSNSFNFLVTVYILSSLYVAFAATHLLSAKKRYLTAFLLLMIILGTLPRIIYEEHKNIARIFLSGGHIISESTLGSMEYFLQETDPDAVIFSPIGAPPPYHEFLSERGTFLGDYRLLGSHEVDTSERQRVAKEIVGEKNELKFKALLKKHNINYIYISSFNQLSSTPPADVIKPVFKNNDYTILKVL